ncbi:hypothetical protein [Roseovarius sp. D22-M7]|uniref:hypothetical protein n=1 Tax=Roseovarius sp. D22-M7 TaxID=3127116 RepID=UPI00300FD7E1
MQAERLPLTALPRILIEAGYSAPTYRTAYEAARDCRIPATQNAGGRWTFAVDDLPAIADALGLSEIAA